MTKKVWIKVRPRMTLIFALYGVLFLGIHIHVFALQIKYALSLTLTAQKNERSHHRSVYVSHFVCLVLPLSANSRVHTSRITSRYLAAIMHGRTILVNAIPIRRRIKMPDHFDVFFQRKASVNLWLRQTFVGSAACRSWPGMLFHDQHGALVAVDCDLILSMRLHAGWSTRDDYFSVRTRQPSHNS